MTPMISSICHIARSRVASGKRHENEMINENVWEAEAMQIRESREEGHCIIIGEQRRSKQSQTAGRAGRAGGGRSPPISTVSFSVSSNAQQSTLAAF